MMITVGVVGVGYWGPKIVRNFYEMPDAKLSWVVDKDGERLARIKAQYPAIEIGQSFEDLLKTDVQAVVVATPVATHYRMVKAALLAGKHVMVEKPLTANADESRELALLADQLGLTLMVGHTFEYNAAIRALREIIASGELGEIYYVDCARLNLGLFQRDINVLWDLAPHDVSILLYILQADPIAVSARGGANVRPGIHDIAYMELQFPNNTLAHVHVSWLDPCKVRRVTIVGSKKMVVCNDVADAEKIRVYDKGVERPYETDRYTDFHLAYRYGNVTIPYIPPREPLRTQCEHFVECVRTGARPQSNAWVGHRVVSILAQADASLHDNGVRKPIFFNEMAALGPIGEAAVAAGTTASPAR
jgi:predicted dehydrogenase